ncbi:F-box domain-containing protein [Mycena sanguinolenta]|uniref:F-box domain-containing protein n=1 Tax=Mycena sanguinolenta TaxID=230812 RepID=A0A8H7DMR7_9AGAR|nr:F-box domain-containing protein [Mycena sanguinolenta]
MASPFVSRLGTNYCPTDEEILEINALLVEPILRLKGLDDEITKFQKSIDQLAEERSRVAAYVEGHRALISPVRRLPLDVIQELFVACLPTHRNCVMNASEVPLLLGRVCNSWRAISLSTPRLWSSLHVVEPLWSPDDPSSALLEDKVARRLEITQTWLGRSGQCPLSISLQSAPEGISPTSSPSPSARARSTRFMETLLSFAPRWQHIQFTSPLSLLSEVMSHFEAEVPLLETAAFHHQGHNPQPSTWGPCTFNMLRGARISSLSIPGAIFLPANLPLQWSQLTTLTVGGPKWSVPLTMTSDALLRVISKCQKLRCCKLMVHDPNGVELSISEHPIVELPFLHTLAIHCVASVAPAVSNLLMHLSLPKLHDFTIFGSTRDCPALGNFLARLVGLESLRIDIDIFSRTSLLETFHTLPSSIRQLRISDIDRPWGQPQTGLDEMLAVLTTSPELCPMLQYFSIDSGYNLSDRAVLRFITARMQESPPALNRIEINFGRQMVVDIMPDLRAFIQMGLAVSLIYLPPQPSQDSPWLGLPDAPSVDWSAFPWPPPMPISGW